jgi:peroxiredoxin
MNRTIISALAILALTSAAFGQQVQRERGARPGREGAALVRPSLEQERMVQRIQQQIDELKANHQSLIDELKAIHATAAKEKAPETAKQIEALVGKRQEAFQSTLRELEQQQMRLRRTTGDRTTRLEQGRPQARQAPDFTLDSFDGKKVKLSDYKGSIVVLEWFNDECPFARYHYEQAKTMIDLAKKYKDKNVVWLTINSTSHTTTEANRDFAKKHNLPYPILDDRTGKVGRLYGARNTPHMFVIDKDGSIAYDGAIDSAPLGKPPEGAGKINYVDKAISELLSGRKVSLPNTPPYGCTVKYAGQ